jgi:hypothetical protein
VATTPRLALSAVAVLVPLVPSAIYRPVATVLLSGWLHNQLPAAPASTNALPLVLLLGRGPAIAAAQRLRQGQAVAAYVSGDERVTSERLLQLGVAPSLAAVDSCACTTWENANRTSACCASTTPAPPSC